MEQIDSYVLNFNELSPDMKNCLVVRSLNKLIRSESNELLITKLSKVRDQVIRLQGAKSVDSGLAYNYGLELVERHKDKLKSLRWYY